MVLKLLLCPADICQEEADTVRRPCVDRPHAGQPQASCPGIVHTQTHPTTGPLNTHVHTRAATGFLKHVLMSAYFCLCMRKNQTLLHFKLKMHATEQDVTCTLYVNLFSS
jgi:hypothetical protein